MSKIDDTQIDKVLFHGQCAHQEIHTPSGQIPALASDAPTVSGKVVAFSAGKQIVPLQIVLPQGLRISNPS
jgi:hypothetical protein